MSVVSEIKNDKTQIESAILKLLKEFEAKYDVSVRAVNLSKSRFVDSTSPKVVYVAVEVEIL